ncbi:MAG: hypothetical protein A3B74_02735 [Candidatus Kerfeldbacteria bacterium RIFCSPHIGHO2_02_FULL_42_14]|uniref:Type II secretion system protein J n=1 Tax=Candidatus Kerfeldbacteria bacterium RIFCSPHIGHO2_02_FULL_42_14 TaxID=1798540 RepID=A0A1G2ARX5_9BACT|nr:MAG: hypothetical protein A3B74_02735 [Candidatus Kerfeldbacteria bacterium RIFCSPHIGHO2_02_FULL_42_14]OGY80456.1 MAG: hypothetical protein A3E60_05355 [Candidatus Kerfeldbacteria bacterium RIFCSPHIGHO2_12_FULL_42_13]OGY83886.1 MAG: hypothetical protein A3I91_04880 [Candidatus Kerfeldbacteria bacterium RIFCSPLOWO2_02_FULL_42_19]OGY86575.1 MAG: hypothetical protein A3G01_04950 [Candidatus Kerfeldbacteria bacterium RIFCSPLOWO2_12_FULL_43_9]
MDTQYKKNNIHGRLQNAKIHRSRWNARMRGFTLIEALIVLAIFAVTMLLATNAFMIVTKNQSRFNAFQSVDEDARYALTFLTRRIQFTTIDYDFYTQQGFDLDIQPQHILALQNERQETEIFRKSGGVDQWDGGGAALELCIIKQLVTCQNANDWEKITPSDVRLNALEFFIAPTTSPWARVPGIPNIQPRVTIVYATEDTDREATLITQTTAVSRFYER